VRDCKIQKYENVQYSLCIVGMDSFCCSLHLGLLQCALRKALPKYYPEIAQEASASLFNGTILVGAMTTGTWCLSQYLYLVQNPLLVFFLMKPQFTKRRGGHSWWCPDFRCASFVGPPWLSCVSVRHLLKATPLV